MSVLPPSLAAATALTAFDFRHKVLPFLAAAGRKLPHEQRLLEILAIEDAGLEEVSFNDHHAPPKFRGLHRDFWGDGGGAGAGALDWFYLAAGAAANITEESWAKVDWNPGIVGLFAQVASGATDRNVERPEWMSEEFYELAASKYRHPDLSASAKPSFSDLLDAFNSWAVAWQARKQEVFKRQAVDKREQADALRTVRLKGEDLHAGAGIDHMTGLVHMAERATTAGVAPPLVVMRDEKGKARHIWLGQERDELLSDAMKRRNTEESARNVVNAELSELVKIRDSRTEPVAKKIAAFNTVNSLLGKFDEKVEAAKKTLAGATIDDLPLADLKVVYIERLEAAATGRQKALKGALTQQAIDNWAACVDIDDALQAVSRECAVGTLRIRNALET
ncbi:MAG: hypothetical protein OXH64_00025, partial [Rhodospirillaceae bacterium]|nr:hypothetical protein [Rhodospirillaceae bacterium]